VLWLERVTWAGRIESRFAEMVASIGEQMPVSLRHASALEPASRTLSDVASALARGLEERRGLDIRRCLTHTGPHRDDLAVLLGGRELRSFGSAGQQRTAAIALRLLESETLRERLGTAPMLLLDDPFAELDVRRSARILELLGERAMGQTILTVPRESDTPPALTALARWRIADGIVSTSAGETRLSAGAA
jgi:DNA replication and repair protein RecF